VIFFAFFFWRLFLYHRRLCERSISLLLSLGKTFFKALCALGEEEDDEEEDERAALSLSLSLSLFLASFPKTSSSAKPRVRALLSDFCGHISFPKHAFDV